MVGLLVGLLFGGMAVRLYGWGFGCLASVCLVCWLAGWFYHLLVVCLVVWLLGGLAVRSADWLTKFVGWLVNWLVG